MYHRTYTETGRERLNSSSLNVIKGRRRRAGRGRERRHDEVEQRFRSSSPNH